MVQIYLFHYRHVSDKRTLHLVGAWWQRIGIKSEGIGCSTLFQGRYNYGGAYHALSRSGISHKPRQGENLTGSIRIPWQEYYLRISDPISDSGLPANFVQKTYQWERFRIDG